MKKTKMTKNRIFSITASLVVIGLILSCNNKASKEVSDSQFNIGEQIRYCEEQATKILQLIPNDSSSLPRNIAPGSDEWRFINYKDWTSGFWPGTLWYLYEGTENEIWEEQADKFSRYLTPLSVSPAHDHDLGFQVFNSFGNGYRLEGNMEYKDIILKTADTLATLFNPKVGTILSWPRDVPNMDWPQHNTIMDNMINLELLFWASKNGGDKSLYDTAISHADVTMKNHFRPDYTTYHVVVYDKETGRPIKKVTHQGYSDDSMWARGQGWAIYGYTMVYRETADEKYLDTAQKAADVFLERLPDDLVPYWDFDAPNIPNEPRDASSAALVASALIELSTLVKDAEKSNYYLKTAEDMLIELSENYQSGVENSAFLLHSTGHKPAGTEIDYSINYADYYYLEALLRLKKLKAGKAIGESLLSATINLE